MKKSERPTELLFPKAAFAELGIDAEAVYQKYIIDTHQDQYEFQFNDLDEAQQFILDLINKGSNSASIGSLRTITHAISDYFLNEKIENALSGTTERQQYKLKSEIISSMGALETIKAKRNYLDELVDKGRICVYLFNESEETFKISLYDTNEKLIVK